MRNQVELTVVDRDGREAPMQIEVKALRGSGFTNRDRQAIREMSDDRRRNGKSWTGKDLWTYRLSPYLLTIDESIDVQGPLTGGEVEVVTVFTEDGVFVGVGSDQCDREMDAQYLEKPKQMCLHPLGPKVWKLEDVSDHWDELQLESQVRVGDTVVDLHRFSMSQLVPLETWIDFCGLRNGPFATIFYCGTGMTVPGLSAELERLGLSQDTARGVGDEFKMRLYDPVLDREIRHSYTVNVLGDDLDERRTQASG